MTEIFARISQAIKENILAPLEIKYYNSPGEIRVGSSLSSVQGLRKHMEDTYMVATYNHLELFSIFDGHGGIEVVSFVSRHLAEALLPPFESREKSGSSIDQLKIIIDNVFKELDKAMFDAKMFSGCCALVAIFDHKSNEIYVINLGDSKGILFDDSRQLILETSEKTPADPEEQDRILNAQSTLIRKTPNGVERIDGMLAVSRAFGDIQWKKPSKRSKTYSGTISPVSVIPSLSYAKLDFNRSKMFYLVLACDGFWFDCGITEPFENSGVMEMVTMEGMGAQQLTEEAFRRGSGDNISAMIVKFQR